MSRYRLSERAKADLDGIWDYVGITNDNPDAAFRQLEEIYEMLSALAATPRIGRRRDDLRSGLRAFPVGPYVILYEIAEEGIDVLAVMHGARDINGLFKPDDQ